MTDSEKPPMGFWSFCRAAVLGFWSFCRAVVDRLFGEPEVVISYALVGGFLGAYFSNPTEQLQGALIVAFTAAVSYHVGTTVGAQRASQQVGEGLGLTRAAVRGLSSTIARDGTVKAEGKSS